MQNELHAAALIEEALGHYRVARRHGAEHGERRAHVLDDLLGAAAIDAAFGDEPVDDGGEARLAMHGVRARGIAGVVDARHRRVAADVERRVGDDDLAHARRDLRPEIGDRARQLERPRR